MSEQTPIRNDEGQINDPALAHEMAIAEDPHREEAIRIKEHAAELIGKVATGEQSNYDSMELTRAEKIAGSEKLDRFVKPGSKVEGLRIKADIKESVNHKIQASRDEQEDFTLVDYAPTKYTAEHITDAAGEKIAWSLGKADSASFRVETAENAKRGLESRYQEESTKSSDERLGIK